MSRYVGELDEAELDDVLLQRKEPVLVAWCGPCRAMAPALASAAQTLEGDAKVCKVNVDENPAVSPRFNLKGIPTLILFKGGRETNRLVGLSSAEQIVRLVLQRN